MRDPQLVWEWYRERRQRISDARPNAAHEAIGRLAQCTDDFLLVTQNVDDLHARGGIPAQKMVQIHGDIFVTRCSRCEFERYDYRPSQSHSAAGEHEHPPSPRLRRTSEQEQEEGIPKCSQCMALMRPGVVWFDEQLPSNEVVRVETFVASGACDVVIVAGTTATFGYIIDWALRGSRDGGELIEVNPEGTPLSRFATRLVREPAAIALPRIIEDLINRAAA
jgi:NAD-dependent deacetylase